VARSKVGARGKSGARDKGARRRLLHLPLWEGVAAADDPGQCMTSGTLPNAPGSPARA
jgi:hypothetical protein